MDFATLFVLLSVIVAIIAGGSVHEYGHARSAFRRGDDTAAQMGRMSLAPYTHIDPFLTILLPTVLFISSGVAFGGMRPVPINPASLRHPSRDMVFTALAGPGYQMLFVCGLFALFLLLSPLYAPSSYAFDFFWYAILVNVIIAAFNLIPIPPLDGSRVLAYFLPPHLREVYTNVPPIVGMLIIFGLLWAGAIGRVLGPVVQATGEVMLWSYETLGLHNLTGNLML